MEAAAAYRHRRLRIGALLLRNGLLSADKLAEALEEKEQTGERLGEIVVRRGWVTEAQVAELLADQSDLPFVSLVSTPPEPRVESLLSSRVGAYFRAVPVRFLDDDTVLVAVSDPTTVALEDLRSAIGLDVRLAVATDSEIKAALAKLDPSQPAEDAASPPESSPPAVLEDETEGPPDATDDAAEAEPTPASPGTPEADHAGSIVVAPPEPDLSGQAAETLADEPVGDATTPPDDGPGELVAIVEIPDALRGDLLEPSEPDAADALFPVDTARSGSGEPAAEHEPAGREPPLGSASGTGDLSLVEPVAGVPLLRVIGMPPGEGSMPPESPPESVGPERGTGQEPLAPAAPDLWLPASAVQPPAEPALWAPAGSPHVEAWTPEPTDEPPAAGEPGQDSEPPVPEHAPADSGSDEPGAIAPEADAALEPAELDAGSTEVEPEQGAAGVEAGHGAQLDAVEPGHEDEPAPGRDGEAPDETPAPALQTIETSLFPVAVAEEPVASESATIVPLFEHRRPQLGTILLRRGVVSPEQLAAALEEKEESAERLGQILVRTGVLSEHGLATALAEQHDIDYVDIAAAPPNVAVASLLPEKYARRYRAVPVRYLDGGVLLVAVADPTDVLASDDLRLVLGVQIQLAVALGTDIDATLDRVHPAGAVTASPASEPDGDEPVEDTAATGARKQGHLEVLEATTNAPAIELVNEVIKHAIQEGASDVHFEPQSERMLVRARIDGVMREMRIIPARLQQAVSARLKIMGELDIAERRAPQDGRVTITFGGRPVDLRIAVLPTLHGEQIVIRVLYRSSNAVDLADLGLATDTETAIRHAIAQPYGALLSVGPTGSGKTTTLYSALRLLNSEDRCVMTIEDPVEYQLEGLNQVQVNVKAGLTFAHGLRTILRSDPDVLLVGEIRDSETAKIAVQAAMTGHLVLSTLHADNVGSAVSRMTDMGVERQLLASTINVILAQRLARKLCTNCREEFRLDPGLLVKAGADERVLPGDGPVTLFKPRGCGQCLGGYKGRIGLFETMLVTPRMRRLMETATAEEIYEVAVADGMRTLQDDGLRLCIEGLTSLDEVKRVAGERRI